MGGGRAPSWGQSGRTGLSSAPFPAILAPKRLPGLQGDGSPAARPSSPPLVLSAVSCAQEELTSTSVEHLIINPNAAFEKFKDKRLGTEGVGELRGPGSPRGPRGWHSCPGCFWG